MQRYDTVAIVGVGLIGGSIGMALRQRGLARRVMGIGRRQATLTSARRLGAVTHITTEIARGVQDADLVVVCTPVGRIVAHVLEAASACPPGAILTDAGSTKVGVVRGVRNAVGRRVRFVGSHPLAGSEKSGAAFARADLFERRTVIVTPARGDREEDIVAIESFWKHLGAAVTRMSPERHDRLLASASHLPHLLAAVLAVATPEEALECVGTGWKDTTRLAGGESQLWTEIVAANRSNILNSWRRFERVLASFRRAVETGNDRQLSQLLAKAKTLRNAVGN